MRDSDPMATNTDTCSCAAVFNIVGLRLGTDRTLPIPIMAKFKFDSGVVPNIIFRKLEEAPATPDLDLA